MTLDQVLDVEKGNGKLFGKMFLDECKRCKNVSNIKPKLAELISYLSNGRLERDFLLRYYDIYTMFEEMRMIMERQEAELNYTN